MAGETISVIVSLTDDKKVDPKLKGGLFFDEEGDIQAGPVEIPVSKLRESLALECNKFGEVLGKIKDGEHFKLDELEVGFEINGEGGVNFIGTAKLGGKAALKVKFSRK